MKDERRRGDAGTQRRGDGGRGMKESVTQRSAIFLHMSCVGLFVANTARLVLHFPGHEPEA